MEGSEPKRLEIQEYDGRTATQLRKDVDCDAIRLAKLWLITEVVLLIYSEFNFRPNRGSFRAHCSPYGSPKSVTSRV
jgi:hypothetical protein